MLCDSYSGYFEFRKLIETTSYEVIKFLKVCFATHGIPQILESDNGPQFSSSEFRKFSTDWKFKHQTSSPTFPRSNGLAEKYVAIAKSTIKKCSMDNSDVFLALLNLRNTPRSDKLGSPVQRLFGRSTRTILPTNDESLRPQTIQNVSSELLKLRQQQKNICRCWSKTTNEISGRRKSVDAERST